MEVPLEREWNANSIINFSNITFFLRKHVKEMIVPILGFHVTSSKNYMPHIEHLRWFYNMLFISITESIPEYLSYFACLVSELSKVKILSRNYCHEYSTDVKQTNLLQITHIWLGL